MSAWYFIVLGGCIIALAWYIIQMLSVIHELRLVVSFLEVNKEYADRLADCRLAEIAVSDELLAVYRALAKKLISAHVTSTHIHLKVRSDYAQDGDLEKALGEITTVLRDSL